MSGLTSRPVAPHLFIKAEMVHGSQALEPGTGSKLQDVVISRIYDIIHILPGFYILSELIRYLVTDGCSEGTGPPDPASPPQSAY